MGEVSQEFTLDEALVAIGFGKFQVYVLAYAGLGFAATGVQTMILSFIGPSVKSEWDLSSTEETLLTSVIFVGMFIGAYLSGFISDNYGRRKGILSAAIVTSGASLSTAFAPNYLSLVILRCLVGVGVGGGAVYSSWFLEFVPAPNRGTWMIFLSVFWTLGTVFEASLAWIILPRLGWRWLLALSSLPAFATLLFYNLAPESPRYLCLKSQTSEAQKLLKRAAIVNQTEFPTGILISDQTTSSDEEEATSLLDPLLLSQKVNITPSGSKTGFSTLRMLFSSSLYRITLQLWVIFFGINFAYYGIILLTSKISSTEQSDCGSSITLHSDVSHDSSYRDILVASFAEFPGIVLSAFIIERIGRKHSMQIMFMLGFVFLLPLLLVQNDNSSTISLVGARIFITGTSTVANIYAPEIYPTSVRATGFGMACAVGGIGGMLCPLVAVVLLNDCHQTAAIILFESVIVLSGLCVFLFPFETKGQELSDNVYAIQQNHIQSTN